MQRSKHTKTIFGIILIAVIAVAIYLLYINKQNIYDEIALYNYKPPTEIASIATQDGMTSYTKKVFYVNHPQIDDKSTFASNCPDDSEDFVVLGCYHLNQEGIYVLEVNNSDLAGIEQVTAAYETLHAIYQRLSPSQQATLNTELLSFEKNNLNDPIVEAQIANFKKTEPGEVLNEMTSLFGTEVPNLTPALTSFYAQYFTNRQTILDLYNSYDSAFTSRQNQINAYDAQLQILQTQVNNDESQLNTELASINTSQSFLNGLKNSGQISQYNANVPSFNQQVVNYNGLVNTTQSLIDQYNMVVSERNSIALEEQQLTQSITSSAKSIPN